MDYILEVNGLKKAYSKSGFVLQDISFALPMGAIMGIVGENGSGKTTTLNIILGLLKQNSGTVKLFGKEFDNDDIETKAKIGVVFDTNSYPLSFSAKDIAQIHRRIYTTWDNDYYYKLLTQFGIDEKQKITKMSHGTKSVLSIIIALSHHPELLILDEPTSGIDPVKREEILDIFLDFVSDGKKSIIFSSHITGDLEKVADYITFIHKGQVVDSVEKDVYLYKYGIVRCNHEAFVVLGGTFPSEVLSHMQRDGRYRILVKNQKNIPPGDYVIENPTLEEIMLLITKGETL